MSRELRLLSKPLLQAGAGGVPGNSSATGALPTVGPAGVLALGGGGVGSVDHPITSAAAGATASTAAASSSTAAPSAAASANALNSLPRSTSGDLKTSSPSLNGRHLSSGGGVGLGGGSGTSSPVTGSRLSRPLPLRASSGGAGSPGRRGGNKRSKNNARKLDKEVMIMRRKSHYSHELSHEEYVKMGENESLDYHVAHNDLFREEQWNTTKSDYRADELSRYVLAIAVGVFVGFAAFVIRFGVETLLDQKYILLGNYLADGKAGVALALYIVLNVAMIFASGILVAYYIPQAAGAGIAEVKGYLNGNRLPKAINVKTFIGKFFGTIMNVAGSLPAGPEGPMIHIGAMIGGGVSQPRSKTLNCELPYTAKFCTDKDRRDFISVGAACGFAAAFSAPIGGILFSLEEASSFWSPSLTVRTFLASMTATLVSNFFLSAPTGSVGVFDVSSVVVFNQGSSLGTLYHYWELIFFIALGCLGGLFGAAFVAINVRIVKWRRERINPKPWRRVAEICALSVAVSIIAFVLPYAVSCRVIPTPDASQPDYSLLVPVRFDCPDGSYNALASLIFTGLSTALKNLFSRGGPADSFPLATLVLFGVVYFFLTVVAAGSVAPAGALIPAFIIGASYGRFCGILLHWVSSDIQPGVYAVIGAASFLAGTSRMTISLSVIMLEITNDLSFLPPIMLAVMCAKWIGDLFTHPLYDQMLETKYIPFLEADPPHELDKMVAGDLMSHDIKYLPVDPEVGHVMRVLLSCTHQGFPVVYSSANGLGKKLRGLVLRKQLLVLIAARVWETQHRFTAVEFRNAMASAVPTALAVDTTLSGADRVQRLDLLPYLNRSPFSVHSEFYSPYVFRLFRSMGLRHLPVVNDDNEVVGMITRKDLINPMIIARYEVMCELQSHVLGKPLGAGGGRDSPGLDSVGDTGSVGGAGTGRNSPHLSSPRFD